MLDPDGVSARGNRRGGMVLATTASAKCNDSCHNCQRQVQRFYEKSDKPSFVVSVAVNCLEERVERGVAFFLFFLLVRLRFLAERFPLVMFGSVLRPCGHGVNRCRGLLENTFDWPSRRPACARGALSVHGWN
jgi:hypothetical protein